MRDRLNPLKVSGHDGAFARGICPKAGRVVALYVVFCPMAIEPQEC